MGKLNTVRLLNENSTVTNSAVLCLRKKMFSQQTKPSSLNQFVHAHALRNDEIGPNLSDSSF